ncbi:MAG: hypothetical protein COY09_01685 [Candidatus Portnoybacteria bacterium CG_4_10_14_0_2_um_filter_39_11]|uniref:Uncharacterized protein n=1 Tax=Candidatus Portnoybacteria bacterium CG_4_10_14_0_2_um_filter_39_11 TaxID=1974797 RepID=A0A2M7UID5_9BACT|nr:MAG: hypothetical protein COY09_01685 [Candidatus Portnoybacteria bacterium CG_4_10_14_0_2_um_filter_39_11]
MHQLDIVDISYRRILMKHVNVYLLILVSLFSLLVVGCKPGEYQLGGQTISVSMPVTTLTSPVIAANIFAGVQSNEAFLPPRVDCPDPRLSIGVALDGPKPTVEQELAIYNLKAKNPVTNTPIGPKSSGLLGITIGIFGSNGEKPLKFLRGADLRKEFRLLYDNTTNKLTFKLSDEFSGQRFPLGKEPRLEGVIARIVTNFKPGPIFPADLLSLEKEDISICKFPITLTKTSEDIVEINSIDIQIKGTNFLWLSPADLFFPNAIIQPNPEHIVLLPDEAMFRIENVVCSTEIEILAPPNLGQRNVNPVPGLELLTINRRWNEIEFLYNEIQYTGQLSRFYEPTQKSTIPSTTMPSTWGKIKSN